MKLKLCILRLRETKHLIFDHNWRLRTDFQNIFTAIFPRNFCMYQLQRSPHYLECITTLPCVKLSNNKTTSKANISRTLLRIRLNQNFCSKDSFKFNRRTKRTRLLYTELFFHETACY